MPISRPQTEDTRRWLSIHISYGALPLSYACVDLSSSGISIITHSFSRDPRFDIKLLLGASRAVSNSADATIMIATSLPTSNNMTLDGFAYYAPIAQTLSLPILPFQEGSPSNRAPAAYTSSTTVWSMAEHVDPHIQQFGLDYYIGIPPAYNSGPQSTQAQMTCGGYLPPQHDNDHEIMQSSVHKSIFELPWLPNSRHHYQRPTSMDTTEQHKLSTIVEPRKDIASTQDACTRPASPISYHSGSQSTSSSITPTPPYSWERYPSSSTTSRDEMARSDQSIASDHRGGLHHRSLLRADHDHVPRTSAHGLVLTNVHNPNGPLELSNGKLLRTPLQYNGGHEAARRNESSTDHYVKPLADRPFKCDRCPSGFARNHDLKRHLRMHLKIKPFSCGQCRKGFTRTDALKVRGSRHNTMRPLGARH